MARPNRHMGTVRLRFHEDADTVWRVDYARRQVTYTGDITGCHYDREGVPKYRVTVGLTLEFSLPFHRM